jgi:chromosome partitioning protein
MSQVVGVVSQKGGVGKSTLSRLLAAAYSGSGWSVLIADLDTSQATSTDWVVRRNEAQVEPAVQAQPFRNVAQALKTSLPYDLVIFDGPPHSQAGTLEIAKASRAVFLPTGLALDDLRPGIRLAHELVEAGIPRDKIAFVLCRAGDRAGEIEEAREYIKVASYQAIKGAIPEKTAFRRASDEGRTLAEVSFPTLREKAEEVLDGMIQFITARGDQ